VHFLLKEHPSVSLALLPVGWQYSEAANTQNYRLCPAKDPGDFIASWTLRIHEAGVGARHQALLLVLPLLLPWISMKTSFARGTFSWKGHHCWKA
jgi:hypothetical protein